MMTTFRLGVIAEPHLAPDNAEPVSWHNQLRFDLADTLLQRAMAWCLEQDVDAIALLGDLTHYADEASFERVMKTVAAPHLPLLIVPGNHDVEKTPNGLRRFRQLAASPDVVSSPGVTTIREIPIVLVAIEWNEDAEGFAAVLPGDFGVDQERFSIVLTHFPVLSMAGKLNNAGLKHAGNLIDRAQLAIRISSQSGPVLALHGHLHVHDAMTSANLLQLSGAALIEPPHHAAVVSIERENESVTIHRKAVSLEQLAVDTTPILGPLEQQWLWNGEDWKLSAN